MRAALPMYDRPETAPALDRLWAGVRTGLVQRGIDAPEHRERPSDLMDLWLDDELLLAQTCSLPLRARLKERVWVLGAGDHRLEGVPAGHYASVIIARTPTAPQALSDQRLAFNDPLSQSGWAAPAFWLMEQRLDLPAARIQTGGHRASAEAVARGDADWAGLDAVTWALIRQFDDFAQSLHVIAQTTPTPALPFITARKRDPEPIRAALAEGIAALTNTDRTLLHLHSLVSFDPRNWLEQPMPPEAVA